MPEVRSDVKEVKEEPIEEKKKGFFGRMKDAAADNESQLEAISTMVRLGILVWSGGILTLAYIKLPPALGIPEQKLGSNFHALRVHWGFSLLLGFRRQRNLMMAR